MSRPWRVMRGHWKRHHSIDHIYEFLFVLHRNYGHIFFRLPDKARLGCNVENRDFLYLPVMYITTITPGKITASILRCFLYNRSIWLDYNMMQITAEKFNPLSMLHQRRYTDRQTDRIAMPIAERTTYERAAKIGPNARQAVLVCLRCIAKLREGPPGGCFPVCHVGQL